MMTVSASLLCQESHALTLSSAGSWLRFVVVQKEKQSQPTHSWQSSTSCWHCSLLEVLGKMSLMIQSSHCLLALIGNNQSLKTVIFKDSNGNPACSPNVQFSFSTRVQSSHVTAIGEKHYGIQAQTKPDPMKGLVMDLHRCIRPSSALYESLQAVHLTFVMFTPRSTLLFVKAIKTNRSIRKLVTEHCSFMNGSRAQYSVVQLMDHLETFELNHNWLAAIAMYWVVRVLIKNGPHKRKKGLRHFEYSDSFTKCLRCVQRGHYECGIEASGGWKVLSWMTLAAVEAAPIMKQPLIYIPLLKRGPTLEPDCKAFLKRILQQHGKVKVIF